MQSMQVSFHFYYCRGLLHDMAATTELPLDEDAATVRLLISGMYDANSPVSCSTVKPLLELARKYDVADILLQCECYLNTAPLSTANLPGYMELACEFGIPSAVHRCQDYVASADNFDTLVR
jgi:BTB/POZ domain